MKIRLFLFLPAILFLFPLSVCCQFAEKVVFNSKDSSNDYYLAVPPISGNILGVQVLISSFSTPENILSESGLPNVAYGNDLLTIIASMGTSLWADSTAVERINHIMVNAAKKFSADTSGFALGGLGYAGNIALRYTEMCYEKASLFPVLPKVVFAVNTPVDLLALANWCEEEIAKNYYSGDVGDAKYILGALSNAFGKYSDHAERYIEMSPFYKNAKSPGNEKYLKYPAVRLYYDTDISWQLKNRRNSYYDTYIPDGSELVKRLLLMGNPDADFISSKQPGMRINGQRSPYAWSVIDEIECIQWIKQSLKIFNPQTYSPVYLLPVPTSWSVERFALPPDFAKQISYKGVEDLRFFPGWGDPKSEDHWSYAFLWWLSGNIEPDESSLQNDLKNYYSGLIARNIGPRKIPAEKQFPVIVKIHRIKSATGDLMTFNGTVDMLNYITQTPMTLNLIVHKKDCSDKSHSFLFFEVSPKPYDHSNWEKMNKLYADFSCTK
jgi:hypothetical protein